MTCVAGHGHESEPRADVLLDGGIDVGERAHRAGQLADRDRRPRALRALDVALDLQREQRELRAVGRRLGVHAVRAPGDRDVDGRRRRGASGRRAARSPR